MQEANWANSRHPDTRRIILGNLTVEMLNTLKKLAFLSKNTNTFAAPDTSTFTIKLYIPLGCVG